jgi:hypothetical protein
MPAGTTDTFHELKTVLQELKTFLDQNVNAIKPAVRALETVVPQITDLINKLIDLLAHLKTEVQGLNVGTIPGLTQVTQFTGQVSNFLTAVKPLLPQDAAEIDDVRGAVGVVGGLSGLDQVKGEIITLIDDILEKLNEVKS